MIGTEMQIDGNVKLKSGLIIYGRINGDVTTEGPVRVASTGTVIGNIQASDIHVNGRVEGDVTVSNRAVLGDQSVLIGDLVYRSLLIDEGAKFEGKCDLLQDQPTSFDEPSPPISPWEAETY